MPDQISVSEFIAETTEDYNSPTTSSFTTRLHNCRNTVTLLEEALDQDRTALQKVKKSVKAIYNSGQEIKQVAIDFEVFSMKNQLREEE